MSTPIDHFDIDRHTRYAVDTAASESFKGKYHITDFSNTRAISEHAMVLDYVPKPEAFQQLFPVNRKRHWPCHEKPPNFDQTRVNFFESAHTIEQDRADLKRLESINVEHENAQEQALRNREREVLVQCCRWKINLREDHNYIKARTRQFEQA